MKRALIVALTLLAALLAVAMFTLFVLATWAPTEELGYNYSGTAAVAFFAAIVFGAAAGAVASFWPEGK